MFNTSLECKEKEESRDEGMEKEREGIMDG